MKIVSTAEMREIDRLTSERYGVPLLTLMENAGSAVADFVLSEFPGAQRIAVVCGKGNNGGDGLVAARKLREAGKDLFVLLLANPSELRGDAALNLKKLPVKAVIADSAKQLGSAAESLIAADLIVDAILGAGFRPPLAALYAEAIKLINYSPAPVVAVDVPSGADADAVSNPANALVARADAVVTFTAPRPAHVFAPLTQGATVIAPIGSPAEAIVSNLDLEVLTAADVAPLIGPRAPDSHKGDFGHVLIIGGSLGKAGAAAMAGMGALRSGAGLVTVATPRSVLATVASFAPELMTEPLAETEAGAISLRALEYGRLDEIMKGKTVVAIGPGISRPAETAQFVQASVAACKLPLVIDADGLNAFAGCVEKLDGHSRPLVLTPHPGEMARLMGISTREVQSNRVAMARKLAGERSAIVVLKGHRTVIAAPQGRTLVNATGNPGMASGGTGDVLTGIISAMMAQNPENIFLAVAAAVYLHGLAGDVAAEKMGEQALLATDLLAALPEAFRRTRNLAGQKTVRI